MFELCDESGWIRDLALKPEIQRSAGAPHQGRHPNEWDERAGEMHGSGTRHRRSRGAHSVPFMAAGEYAPRIER